jgi:hypothetical protein
MYIDVEEITESLFFIHIYGTDYSVYHKINKIFENYKELLPPWIVFPNMFMGGPRWSQGYQEHYCWNYWIPYWRGLDNEEKDAYYVKHNAPQEWIDWLTDYKDKIM